MLLCPWNSLGKNTGEWSFLSPGDLSDPGIQPRSPALLADSLPSEPPGNIYLLNLGCTESYFGFSRLNFTCILNPSSHPTPNTCLILLVVEAASVKLASLSFLGLLWIVSGLPGLRELNPAGLCLSFIGLRELNPQHHSTTGQYPGGIHWEAPAFIYLWSFAPSDHWSVLFLPL